MTVKDLYDSFGGNYAFAVQTMMNDAFIKRMLAKFLEKNTYSDIQAHYEEKNFHLVFEASHSLKGVCGNLGLTPLYEKASVICEATRHLKEGETVNLDGPIGELKESFEKISSSIRAFLSEN